MAPLNSKLYDLLRRAFGEVRIANEGEGFNAKRVQPANAGITTKNRTRLDVSSSGEYYRVNCPCCSDTRQRLWINHRWNTVFEGERISHLMVCYNEHCEQNKDFRAAFNTALQRTNLSVRTLISDHIEDGRISTEKPTWPGVCTTVDKLYSEHVILGYLRQRGLDSQILGSKWSVSWCEYSTVFPSSHRLIFPIYTANDAGEVVYAGSQARYFDININSSQPPDKHTPKYLTQTGTKRSQILYNGYRAKTSQDLVVLTEGPIDAINIGIEHGVALFGKAMTSCQADLISTCWNKAYTKVIVALDEDAYITEHGEKESAVFRAHRLLSARGWPESNLLNLRLPNGKDPGDIAQTILWEEICALLKKGRNVETGGV
jgi:hypothetical protein